MRTGLVLTSLALAAPLPAQVTIGGHTYEKGATRETTRAAFLEKVTGARVEWGPWHMLAPFHHPAGSKDIAAPYPPEDELPAHAPRAAGPDLTRAYNGKAGKTIHWREVAQEQDIGGLGGLLPLDFRAGLPKEEQGSAVGYLYRAVTVSAPTSLPVAVGSDDGVRLWLNGRLLIDENAERALDPGAHRITLDLEPGVNHLFVKVSQGYGEWAFQLSEEQSLDPVIESALDWHLASDFPTPEDRYYRIATIPVPRGIELEVGGLDVMPDGRPILCSRRGEVYIVENAYETPPTGAEFHLFADGLQEPLGLRVHPGGPLTVYAAQRAELTRLTDTDNDGAADLFETVCDDWSITGNYHEYAFGPKFDRDGNAWVTLNLAHTGGETVMGATVPTRGWAVKITPEGEMIKVADGLRSPDGIGIYSDGEMFYTDNQGDYVATCKLSHLAPGSFHGHQASLRFREGWQNWRADGKPLPDITPPAVWFPYKKMGQSASDICLDDTGGRFGPFEGQLFIGDQTHATVMRVALEKAGDLYQGACFPFRAGFASGVHRLTFAPDGSLFVGMTDRGWGSTGPKRFGLQRLIWTGETPFEIHSIAARPDGFELTFTHDVEPFASTDPASYRITSYTYLYRPDYGSPEVDTSPLTITACNMVGPRTVRIRAAPLREGYVHEIDASGARALPQGNERPSPLLHHMAYYTLQRIPDDGTEGSHRRGAEDAE